MERLGPIVCGVVTVLAIVFVYFSWDILEPTDIGIDFDSIWYVTGDVKPAGRHYLGFGHYFIRFPARAQTFEFTDQNTQFKRGNLLQSRSSDGLEVQLEVSLQYQFQMSNVLDAFYKFGTNYEEVYVRLATDTITREATRNNATFFFRNREVVSDMLKSAMQDTFENSALCSLTAFQLRKVILPAAFETQIETTEVKKQDIDVAKAEVEAKRTEGQTWVLQAQQEYQSRIFTAQAAAETITLNNQAYVQQFNLTQMLQAQGFETIYLNLGVEGDAAQSEANLLEYMRMRALRDHTPANSIISVPTGGSVQAETIKDDYIDGAEPQ